MGVTLTGTKSSIDLSGGYSMMMHIRTRVANAFDKEFGEHYKTLFEPPFFKEDDWYKAFNKKANEILSDKRFKDEDREIVKFLFMSDSEGKIRSTTCGKIYNLIKDTSFPDLALRYIAYSDNDWEDFKALLKECFSKRMNLIWY